MSKSWAETWGVDSPAPHFVLDRLRKQLTHAFKLPERWRHYWTPAQCGMALMEHAIGREAMAPLPDDVQALIRETAVQNREEGMDPAQARREGAVVYDGRLMYGACCESMYCGPVEQRIGGDLLAFDRGRARVRFRIPRDWCHLGLLPLKQNGVHWLRQPGFEGETWCDLAEARFAQSQGWQIEVAEMMCFHDARCLDPWIKPLKRLWAEADARQDYDLRDCYRAIIIHAIGAFHNPGTRKRTVFVPEGREKDLPKNHPGIWGAPGGYQYEVIEPDPSRPSHQRHPEWSAAVWARARLRMVKAALTQPRENVLGIFADALYLRSDPGGFDQGRIGDLRRKD